MIRRISSAAAVLLFRRGQARGSARNLARALTPGDEPGKERRAGRHAPAAPSAANPTRKGPPMKTGLALLLLTAFMVVLGLMIFAAESWKQRGR